MNTKYLNIWADWHLQKRGCLFFGFQIDFPFKIVPRAESYDVLEQEDFCTHVFCKLGLLLFTINFEIKYNHCF